MNKRTTGAVKMNESEFAVFTVCNIAYLPKALVLADSLYEHHGKLLNIVIFDRKQEFRHPSDKINILWVEELGLPEWKQLAFMYDIIEYSTSLKPYIATKLLQQYEKVIFLDPDTAMFSRLDPILSDLDISPVVLTPHYIKPQPDTPNESDLAMMRFGSFNLGFFAVRKGDQSSDFLNWWNRRCLDFSFMESQFGLSTDQKWVSIAPCFFEFLKVSFNPGYNAAPWNTFERKLTKKIGNQYWINDKYPLIFFHFSNFNHDDPQYLLKRASNELGVKYELLEELGKDYSKRLKVYEYSVEKIPYTYDFMSDGTYISPTLRRAYASIKEKLNRDHDPFDSEGAVGTFAIKNKLITAGTRKKYAYPGLTEAKKNKRIFSFIYFGMRLLLRVLGPNRFYDLSKLMVYLSIFRKNHDYWRI